MKHNTVSDLEYIMLRFKAGMGGVTYEQIDYKKAYNDAQDKLIDLCLKWIYADRLGEDLSYLDAQITICEQIIQKLNQIMTTHTKVG